MEQFDESFDRLWEDFASQIDVAVCRDREYLTWRLSERPGETYRTLGSYREGRLEGFISFCHKRAEGNRIGYVMELIYAPGRHAAGRALLGRALVELARDDCDVVLAWNFAHSPNRRAYRVRGFLPLPAALRGTELHMGVRALGARADALVDRRSWYISYCDSDTA